MLVISKQNKYIIGKVYSNSKKKNYSEKRLKFVRLVLVVEVIPPPPPPPPPKKLLVMMIRTPQKSQEPSQSSTTPSQSYKDTLVLNN